MKRPSQQVLVVQLTDQGSCHLQLSLPADGQTNALLTSRLPSLRPFLDIAQARLWQLGHTRATFNVQLHDEDPETLCFRFDAPVPKDAGGPLIPDPYALGSNGFEPLRQRFASNGLPPWKDRLAVAVWRGSSTGSPELNNDSLASNLRYQLCRKSRSLARHLDARLTAVVQCRDQTIQASITDLLRREQLLSERMSPEEMAQHRWLLDLDGNVNSWGLLWKLLSGSCVLRVTSSRQQWYHHRLLPWHHVVPIAGDLSDLEEILNWCFLNPSECEAIAHEGQRLATTVVQQLKLDQEVAVDQYAANWL